MKFRITLTCVVNYSPNEKDKEPCEELEDHFNLGRIGVGDLPWDDGFHYIVEKVDD